MCGSTSSTRRAAAHKAWIDLLGTLLLLFPFMPALPASSFPYVDALWAIFERSRETSGLPLVFPLKTLIPLFALLMPLQGVVAGDPCRAAAGDRRRLMGLRSPRDPDGGRPVRRADGGLSGRAHAWRRLVCFRGSGICSAS